MRHGVERVVVSSSGAAYGYHADNPAWLTEDDPVRGTDTFPYSLHKRLVEEMLAGYRESAPQLEQVVLRIGTILGETVDNQITDLFRTQAAAEDPRLGLALRLHLGPGRDGDDPAGRARARRPASTTSPATAR